MSYIAIFIGGILSFFSPCILPVLPLYIGYLSEYNLDNKKNIAINTICFTVGISCAFIFLGFGFSTLGQYLSNYKHLFSKFAGIFTILLGLFQLDIIKSNFLSRQYKLEFTSKKMNPFIAFILGFTFSFAWTPCIGPALTSVLFAISSLDTKEEGMTMMFLYTLGFIIPFIITGFFSSYCLKTLKKNMIFFRYIPKILGLLLVILGILIYKNKLNYILTFII